MNTTKILSALVIVSLTVAVSFGQQTLLDNNYLVNKFTLNPAYAGFNGNTEAFLMHRHNWVGFDNSPYKQQATINGALSGKSGLGASLRSEKYGVFRNSEISLTYSHSVKITQEQGLVFGLSAHLFDANIVYTPKVTEEFDPVVFQGQVVRGITYDAGFGMAYYCNNFNIGVSAPSLLGNQITDNETKESIYTTAKHIKGYVNYQFSLGRNIDIDPYVIYNSTGATKGFIEFATLIKYKNAVWAGVVYRSTETGINVGGVYKRMALNYSYGIAGSDIMINTSGSHEISLGFLIKDNKTSKSHRSIFKGNAEQPYHQWIN